MKQTRKAVLICLGLLLAAALCGCAAVIADGICGENLDNLTWTLDDRGLLTISGSGAMKDYDSDHPRPWDAYRYKIKSLRLSEGMSSIGDNAFVGCDSLTSVTIPEGVTSIGDWAFLWCDSLSSVTIPSSVSSIGDGAFRCSALSDIQVSSENPNYSSLNGVLYDKAQTLLLQYPAGKMDVSFAIPEGVTSIGDGAFYGCDSLTSVTIPEGVSSIGDGAFYDCDSLTSVTIPSSVSSIGDGAFAYCDSLTSVTIPESVTEIGNHAFYNCGSLVIHGSAGSYAETYAKAMDIPFKAQET